MATLETVASIETGAGVLTPGWYENLPMEEYLAIPAMSASGMEDARRSFAHFKHAQENPKASTPAQELGTAVHLALLEPDLFAGRYVAVGQCEGAKKNGERCSFQGSLYRDGQSFCKTHDPYGGAPMEEGIQIMPAEALDRIEGMRLAVLRHPDAREFFRGRGRSEVTGIWKDPETGVLCKIRLDRQIERASHIHADLKTTTDASEEAFTRQAGRMGYVRKSAWYRRGMAALGTPATASVLIAVESAPPHGCQTFLLDEDDLKACGRDIDRILRQYAECLKTSVWRAYDAGLRLLKLKPWDVPDSDGDAEVLDAA